ncbi:MAG: hypothetical protein JWQ89_4313 [Devosia sp.]|nr:hypothetical protein [Devosia sp.]
MNSLLERLGVAPATKPLTEVVKVRIDSDSLHRLDQIEALARGAGYRQFSRSDMIRAAIEAFTTGVFETVPEVSDVRLPGEAS